MKHNFTYIMLIVICTAILSGCQLQRNESDAGNSDLTGEVLTLKPTSLDLELLTETFLGLSVEEAEQYRLIDEHENYYQFQMNGLELIYTYNASGEVYWVRFYDHRENASSCYELIVDPIHYLRVVDGISSGLRAYYPEEELESCSREEVLSFCQPYAEACGYGNAKVSTYAMTLDILQEASVNLHGLIYGMQWGDGETIVASAPDPEAPLVYRDSEIEPTSIPWSKKDEAILLVYQPYLDNGYLMDSTSQILMLIYVPEKNEIVYTEASSLYVQAEKTETVSIVSQENAIEQVKLLEGIKDEDDITINKVEYVYGLNISQYVSEHTCNPCWKIDYTLNHSAANSGVLAVQSRMIDATTGQEVNTSRGQLN
ncbi:MAG: hypothetical protein ACI4C1_06515 [Lachnospiraceae bacterium]